MNWKCGVHLWGVHLKKDISPKRQGGREQGAGEASRTESGIRAELARLTRITEELSPQLEQEPTLLDYARLVQRVLRTSEQVSLAELRSSYQVEDLELKFPHRLLPEELVRTLTSSRQIPLNLEGFPAIQTFEFKVRTITINDEDGGIEPNLQPFEFDVALIEVNQSPQISRDNSLEIADEIIFTKTAKHLNDTQQLLIQGTLANQTL